MSECCGHRVGKVLHATLAWGLFVLLGAGQAGAVPTPGPLEVRLDRAKAVVLGEVIRVKNTDSADGTRWTRTTLSVKEVLKGDAADTIESRSRSTESGHLGLDTVGNSGIWLIGADGRIAYPHGHLQEAQKPDVQRILKMLAGRKWSGETNGLKAWATVIDRRFAGRPGLLFAVMNCSRGEIFVPRPNCRPGILTASVTSAGGKDVVFDLRRGEPCKALHCDRLPAGEITYLISGYSYIDPNGKLPAGKYHVVLTYRNADEGVRLRPVGVKGEPVDAWKGKLRAPPIEIVLAGGMATPKGDPVLGVPGGDAQEDSADTIGLSVDTVPAAP